MTTMRRSFVATSRIRRRQGLVDPGRQAQLRKMKLDSERRLKQSTAGIPEHVVMKYGNAKKRPPWHHRPGINNWELMAGPGGQSGEFPEVGDGWSRISPMAPARGSTGSCCQPLWIGVSR